MSMLATCLPVEASSSHPKTKRVSYRKLVESVLQEASRIGGPALEQRISSNLHGSAIKRLLEEGVLSFKKGDKIVFLANSGDAGQLTIVIGGQRIVLSGEDAREATRFGSVSSPVSLSDLYITRNRGKAPATVDLIDVDLDKAPKDLFDRLFEYVRRIDDERKLFHPNRKQAHTVFQKVDQTLDSPDIYYRTYAGMSRDRIHIVAGIPEGPAALLSYDTNTGAISLKPIHQQGQTLIASWISHGPFHARVGKVKRDEAYKIKGERTHSYDRKTGEIVEHKTGSIWPLAVVEPATKKR